MACATTTTYEGRDKYLLLGDPEDTESSLVAVRWSVWTLADPRGNIHVNLSSINHPLQLARSTSNPNGSPKCFGLPEMPRSSSTP